MYLFYGISAMATSKHVLHCALRELRIFWFKLSHQSRREQKKAGPYFIDSISQLTGSATKILVIVAMILSESFHMLVIVKYSNMHE